LTINIAESIVPERSDRLWSLELRGQSMQQFTQKEKKMPWKRITFQQAEPKTFRQKYSKNLFN